MVFEGLQHNNYSVAGFVEYINAIFQTKTDLSLEDPYSVAELGLSEDDFQFLLSWSKDLSSDFVKKCFNNPINDERWNLRNVFGLLLVVLISEYVRRNGQEGEVWPAVSDLVDKQFKRNIKSLLINSSYNPTKELKETMECAIKLANLRNAFDIKHIQAWDLTIYLQVAFTISDLKFNLPAWLCGYNTTKTIELLKKIPSFKRVWNLLIGYRNNKVDVDTIIEELELSPWFLDNWINDILKSSKRKIHLSSIIENVENEIEIKFLSEPKLLFDDKKPCFELNLINISYFNLLEPYYNIYVGTNRVKIIRNEDASYSKEDGTNTINLEESETFLFSKNIIASIVSPDNKIIATQAIKFLEVDEDINLFGSDGLKVEPFNTKLSKLSSYHLIFTDDLKIEFPDTVKECDSFKGYKTYHLVSNSPKDSVKVLFNDNVIWTPLITNDERVGLNSMTVQTLLGKKKANGNDEIFKSSKLPLSEACDLFIIGIPSNQEVSYIRFAKTSKEFTKDNVSLNSNTIKDVIIVPNFEIDSSFLLENLKITIGFENKNVKPMKINLRPKQELQKFSGCLFLNEGNWDIIDGTNVNSVEKLKSSLYKVIKKFDDPIYIVEGDIRSSFVKSKISNLENPLGYGNSLKLQNNYYNSRAKEIISTLASKVVDLGMAQDAEFFKKEKKIVFKFSSERELTSEKIVFWKPSTKPKFYDAVDYVTVENCKWIVTLPEKEKDIHCAFIISSDGHRIASIWNENLPETLQKVFNKETIKQSEIERTLSLIRYLHLPICSNEFKTVLKEALNKNPLAFINQWIVSKDCLVKELKLIEDREKWLIALREVFWSFQINVEDSVSLIKSIVEPNEMCSDIGIKNLLTLGFADPFLFCKIIIKFLNYDMKNANLIQEKVLLLKCFLSKVNDISYEDVLRDIPDDIDDGFLIHLEHIGFSFANNQEISAIDKQNLRILLTNENFRKFIIYSILSNFLK